MNRYSDVAEEGLLIGSGSVESAIRRVVNLRLKGASLFWLKETAEAVLYLRAHYKTDRWNMLRGHVERTCFFAQGGKCLLVRKRLLIRHVKGVETKVIFAR
jgi:hypothetical protein